MASKTDMPSSKVPLRSVLMNATLIGGGTTLGYLAGGAAAGLASKSPKVRQLFRGMTPTQRTALLRGMGATLGVGTALAAGNARAFSNRRLALIRKKKEEKKEQEGVK